jgi:two-component system chemotaxis response regulator CheB
MPEPAIDRVVAIGVSSDGLTTLGGVLGPLPADFRAPVLVVRHRAAPDPLVLPGVLPRLLQKMTALRVVEPVHGEPLQAGTVYVAPGGRHLRVVDGHVELDEGPRVSFARPSIDVLFESVAAAYGGRAIGVLLSGGGTDGVRGLHAIKRGEGITIVQDPQTARFPYLPRAALITDGFDFTLPLDGIGKTLIALVQNGSAIPWP